MSLLGFHSRTQTLHWESGSPFLPAFNFHECHDSAALDAPAPAIIATVAALDMRADWVADWALALRELPSRLTAWRRETAADGRKPFGFETFIPLQRDSHELSYGLVGRFWRPDMGLVDIEGVHHFLLHDDPHVAKLVLRFKVIERTDGTRILRTETFVHCASLRAKLLFTPYWLAIRLMSGWIRRRTLMLIRRQLDAAAG
jgi:hypothetical protein